MKRLLVLMTLIVLVQSFPLSVSADLIYEPQDDFLEQHCLECRYVDRKYVANGPDGELTVYKSPENCMIQAEVPNRESIYISYVYTDDHGIEWGCVTLWDQGIIGWVPMPYVVPIYNGSNFRNEIKPSGISPTAILITAAAVAAISAGLLVVLKKKKT